MGSLITECLICGSLITECLICGSSDIIHGTSDEVFNYKGSRVVINDYKVYYCNRCGLDFVSKDERIRSEAVLKKIRGCK
jgi:YgiT-type zinc finger domain-containing protein